MASMRVIFYIAATTCVAMAIPEDAWNEIGDPLPTVDPSHRDLHVEGTNTCTEANDAQITGGINAVLPAINAAVATKNDALWLKYFGTGTPESNAHVDEILKTAAANMETRNVGWFTECCGVPKTEEELGKLAIASCSTNPELAQCMQQIGETWDSCTAMCPYDGPDGAPECQGCESCAGQSLCIKSFGATLDMCDTQCTPGIIAFVPNGEAHAIQVGDAKTLTDRGGWVSYCPEAFSESPLSFGLVTFHELVHKFGGPVDGCPECYGDKEAVALAASDPDKARETSNNYMLYVAEAGLSAEDFKVAVQSWENDGLHGVN